MPTTSEPVQEIALPDFMRKLRVPPGYVAPTELTYDDLVWHEVEFRDGTSFTYAVFDNDGGYLGCCYLYPMGRRDPLSEDLVRHDVDVSWWVTAEAYEQGYYAKLHEALTRWVVTEFPFTSPYFSNRELPA
jgi:RimJ/RimL family protein N-acetyltransferase